MTKPNIKLNDQGISDEEALQFKSFDKVMQQAGATLPTPNNAAAGNSKWAVVAGGSLVVAVVAGLFLFLLNEPDNKLNQSPVAEVEINNGPKRSIERPIPGIPVTYEEFTINSSVDSEVTTKKGTVIRVAANSLRNEAGQTVSGEVQLRYREFRDVVDIFLSGIPMAYDSAGTEYHFESAGMFELLGTQGNSALNINPEFPASVAFASDFTGDRYNQYYFDTDAGRWIYLGKDTAKGGQNNGALATEIASIEAEIDRNKIEIAAAKQQQMQLVKPALLNATQFHIALDVLPEEYPELAVYNNLKWEIGNDEDFNPAMAKQEWDAVRIKKTKTGTYLLHFEKGRETVEFDCKPVFGQADYATAKAVFDANFAASQALISTRQSKAQELAIELEKQRNSQTSTLQAYRNRAAGVTEVGLSCEKVMRIFTTANFGIYNSDCPSMLPQGALLAGKLHDTNEKVDTNFLQFGKAWLAEKDPKSGETKNALYAYYALNQFSFNPAHKNILWAITDKNELAIYTYTKFDELKADGKGEEFVFQMELIPVKKLTELELRQHLKI